MCRRSRGVACNSNLHAKYNKFYFFISILFQMCSSYMIGYWPQSNNIPWYRTDATACVYLSQIRHTLQYCLRIRLQTPGNFFLWPAYQTTRCHNPDHCRDLHHEKSTLKYVNILLSSVSITYIYNFFSFDKVCIFGLYIVYSRPENYMSCVLAYLWNTIR